ncbi:MULTISPECIES: hypothetical protein [Sandaracinus]|uniref:hypothetical protein n=1 Tax=Sandaracinus TaxID=1055688 RepID=UPI0019D439D1|nr:MULTISPECIES: hypothetical protein [Sandaracinus]QRN75829.1 Hypothetical protein MSR10575_89160 [Sandaracinus sp.]UJR87364.1 Hypothetical protein I5071_1560 [Sandaracinus amylolyticus]
MSTSSFRSFARSSFLLSGALALLACNTGIPALDASTAADARPAADASATDPAIAACEAAADAYIALCGEAETDPGRRCEVETYRDVCATGSAAAIGGVYDCLRANRMEGGVCATFSDLATSAVRACAWAAVGTTTPSASATAARDAYCAVCTGATACLAPSEAAPEAWAYFSDATNEALADCFAAAASCDAASACIAESPLSVCY